MAENSSIPSFRIRRATYDEPADGTARIEVAIPSEVDGLPVIHDDGHIALGRLLRMHQIKGVDDRGFWPEKLLRHIMTRERVQTELRTYRALPNAESYLEYIRPLDDSTQRAEGNIYLKIFSLLVLFDRGQEIGTFVKEQVCDYDLPLRHCPNTPDWQSIYCTNARPQPVQSISTWPDCMKEDFFKRQWEFLVPYFELDQHSKAKHETYDKSTILPWCEWKSRPHTAAEAAVEEGGFAFVSRVKIHPSSHGFGKVFRVIRLNDSFFALKKLRDRESNDEAAFRREMEQLNRFSGLVHPHLVTLLATFQHNDRYHFLFPYAEHALDQYWEVKEPRPPLGKTSIRWVAKQCLGIMSAIDIIHDPNHLMPLKEKRFGRHGDIKPENILWFRSLADPDGILVVSDMGLSSFNRDTSRSNIPNSKIPRSPGYRPPECDVMGGTVSRMYDIWTLGCLYLELLTWLIGGWELIKEFDRQRTTTNYITKSATNIFFDVKKYGSSNGHVAQVKLEVTEWFGRLHNHERCSDFIHDFLKVIEDQMLVVLSEDKKRSTSRHLRTQLEIMYAKCTDDANDNYWEASSVRRPYVSKGAIPVDIEFNENAKQTIAEGKPELSVYVGPTRRSMSFQEWKKLDDLK